jgi:hypothetical protein
MNAAEPTMRRFQIFATDGIEDTMMNTVASMNL